MPTPLRYSTVSFLSDYGLADEFVGLVKSVIRSITPEVLVIDITHQIPPHDVRAGGLALARSAQYLAAGIVLAVVDPGVGTERRAIAVEVGDGQSVLLGPDNGLLAPAVALVGGADRAVHLDKPEYQLPAPGATFAGRDVFAPAAAHLAAGVPLTDLGTEVDPATLMPGLMPLTREQDGGLVAEILWVDNFGNAQLNVDPEEIAEYGERLRIEINQEPRTAKVARTYRDLKPGEVGLVIDSYGLLSVAVDRGSAAAELHLAPGDEVVLSPLEDDDGDERGRPIATPIALRRKEP